MCLIAWTSYLILILILYIPRSMDFLVMMTPFTSKVCKEMNLHIIFAYYLYLLHLLGRGPALLRQRMSMGTPEQSCQLVPF